jgi:hypothetical protein
VLVLVGDEIVNVGCAVHQLTIVLSIRTSGMRGFEKHQLFKTHLNALVRFFPIKQIVLGK